MEEPEDANERGGAQLLRCAVLLLVLSALVYWIYDTKIRSPLGPIEAHVELVQAGEIQRAHQTMSSRYRAANDLAAFEKLVADLPGVYESTNRWWYAVGEAGRTEAWETGRVRVACEVPDGAAIFEFQLVEEDGEQRIDAIASWKRD